MKKAFCLLLCLLALPCAEASALETSASASIVINADTGEVLFSENADSPLPMASTTKIMTALLLCENADLDKEITVTEEMLRVEGSSMGLLAGDSVSFHCLLYGMLLASGNDAANATAISLSGSVEEFARMMNRRAAELGLKSTHFVTPSGLDAEGHYTTARDLSVLAAFALKNKHFSEAAKTKTATLYYGNPPYKRTVKNHNKLLCLFDGAIGVKTGFTKKSGRCLVSAAERDGKTVVAVTLNDPNDWDDHTAMLNFGLDEIKQTRFLPPTDCYNIPIVGAECDKLEVFIEPYTVNTLETSSITCTVKLPRFLYAPISKGMTVGMAEYRLGEKLIGTAELKASVNIQAKPPTLSPIQRLLNNAKYILLDL